MATGCLLPECDRQKQVRTPEVLLLDVVGASAPGGPEAAVDDSAGHGVQSLAASPGGCSGARRQRPHCRPCRLLEGRVETIEPCLRPRLRCRRLRFHCLLPLEPRHALRLLLRKLLLSLLLRVRRRTLLVLRPRPRRFRCLFPLEPRHVLRLFFRKLLLLLRRLSHLLCGRHSRLPSRARRALGLRGRVRSEDDSLRRRRRRCRSPPLAVRRALRLLVREVLLRHHASLILHALPLRGPLLPSLSFVGLRALPTALRESHGSRLSSLLHIPRSFGHP